MSDLTSSIARLEASLSTKIGSSFDIDEIPDVVDLLLREKRSPNTRREYKKDINKFFQAVANEQPNRDLVWEFLHLEQQKAVQLVLNYKAQLRVLHTFGDPRKRTISPKGYASRSLFKSNVNKERFCE
jgi:hypothetical protein